MGFFMDVWWMGGGGGLKSEILKPNGIKLCPDLKY